MYVCMYVVFFLYCIKEITHLDYYKFVSCCKLCWWGRHGQVTLFKIEDSNDSPAYWTLL